MKRKLKVYCPTLTHPLYTNPLKEIKSVEFIMDNNYLIPVVHKDSGLSKIVNPKKFDLYECYDKGVPINKISFIAYYESSSAPWWHEQESSINKILKKKITNIKKRIFESSYCKLLVFECKNALNKNKKSFTKKMISKSIILNGGVVKHKQNKLEDRKDLNLLFAGHDFERKGGDILLDAFDELTKKYEDLKLTIFSNIVNNQHPRFKFSDKKREEYIKRMQQNKNIKLIMGGNPLKSRYGYSSADILVFPTLLDNLGTVAMEGESYGLPIVSTEIGGVPEQVEDGINGFLIKSFNKRMGCDYPTFGTDKKKYHKHIKKELVKYISLLMEDYQLRGKMGKESYKIWQKKFSMEKRVNVLEFIYKEAVKKRLMDVSKIRKKIRTVYKG